MVSRTDPGHVPEIDREASDPESLIRIFIQDLVPAAVAALRDLVHGGVGISPEVRLEAAQFVLTVSGVLDLHRAENEEDD